MSKISSPLIPVLLLASLLRFHLLSAQSFWNDEGNSARIAERSLRLILEGAAGDIHPPGYYLLLAGWRAVAGESEFALRSLSALAGVALVALVYRLGRAYFDIAAALGAALFAAAHPALIYYSQEARMYSLTAALGAATFLIMTRWLKATRGTGQGARRKTLALAYILTAALGLYTHYSFAFVLAAANLAALGGMAFHRRELFRPRAARWLAMQLGALALFAPWLPIAVRQVTTWPSAREYPPPGQALAGAARWLTLGPTIDAASAWPGLLAMALLLALALRRGGQTITPLLWLAVPAGLTLGLGLFSEAFAKFLLAAVPALCLFLGHGAASLVRPRLPSLRGGRFAALANSTSRMPALLAGLCAGLLAGSMALSLRHLYSDPAYARDNYRAIARLVEASARPGDAILLNAANQWEVFTYYHRADAPVYPIPRARPPDPARTSAELEQIAAEHDRLFVLWWGEAQADPERVVETWLSRRAFKANDEWYGEVRLSTYATAPGEITMETPLAARFGDLITLDGYSLLDTTVAPGDILRLALIWHSNFSSNAPLPPYKVFVHLTALDGLPLAQHDGEPGSGLRPTSTWAPGETVQDNHGVLIPADLSPGEYRLLVGLYGLEDGTRLPVTVDRQEVGDSLLLAQVVVGPGGETP